MHQLGLPLYGMPRSVRQQRQYLQARSAVVVCLKNLFLFLIESVYSTTARHSFPEIRNVEARRYGIEPVNRQAYPMGRNGLDFDAVDEQGKRSLPLGQVKRRPYGFKISEQTVQLLDFFRAVNQT